MLYFLLNLGNVFFSNLNKKCSKEASMFKKMLLVFTVLLFFSTTTHSSEVAVFSKLVQEQTFQKSIACSVILNRGQPVGHNAASSSLNETVETFRALGAAYAGNYYEGDTNLVSRGQKRGIAIGFLSGLTAAAYQNTVTDAYTWENFYTDEGCDAFLENVMKFIDDLAKNSKQE